MTDWAARILNIRRGELPLAGLAAVFFFCVLCGYYFVRPVRDAMGVSRGMDELRWLFAVTVVSSLVLVLLFGGVVARINRRRFIPAAYGFVVACLIGFSALLFVDVQAGGGLFGSGSETVTARGVAYTFYVWLSVVNLFITSIFWAFMVDVFNVDQGKRIFAFIGIGGTLGALVGSSATTVISSMTQSAYLPIGLMLAGAALFVAATAVMLTLDRLAARSPHSRLGGAAELPDAPRASRVSDALAQPGSSPVSPAAPMGGRFFDGVTAVARSPYLLGIALFIVFMAVSNTLIYFTQANIVLNVTDVFSQQVAAFGLFDVLTQIVTLFTQIFVTTRLIRRIGVGWTLAILPLVTLAGFALLAIWPVYGVMAVFQAVHRATRYAISRPSRESLFSAVPPEERYKAKPVIDVVLYRFGDLAGVGIQAVLSALGSLTLMVGATVPFAAVWSALSVALGRAQSRRDPANQPAAVELPAGSRAETST